MSSVHAHMSAGSDKGLYQMSLLSLEARSPTEPEVHKMSRLVGQLAPRIHYSVPAPNTGICRHAITPGFYKGFRDLNSSLQYLCGRHLTDQLISQVGSF